MPYESESMATSDDSVVSFQTEMPLLLQQAMTRFIEEHPNWDQYRLVQAALAGFLVQNGIESGKSPAFMWATCFGGKSCCTASEFGSSPSGSTR